MVSKYEEEVEEDLKKLWEQLLVDEQSKHLHGNFTNAAAQWHPQTVSSGFGYWSIVRPSVILGSSLPGNGRRDQKKATGGSVCCFS